MMDISSYQADIESIPEYIIKHLIEIVEIPLLHTPIFYRIFGRKKSYNSFVQKQQKKLYNLSHKMQDLFGVRITVYFKDDIDICEKIIRENFNVDDLNTHIDKEEATEFKPTVMNIICKLPDSIRAKLTDGLFSTIIDDTFEIQIRTVFSEGWHEVEHDLRYKCKEEWEDEQKYSRVLNGIYATLVTCDWSMIQLFNDRAYNKYRCEDWESMIKNKFRIKFIDNQIVNQQFLRKEFMKKLYKLERKQVITKLISNRLPCTMDNFLYIVNEFFIQDDSIVVPEIVKKCIDDMSKLPVADKAFVMI